MKNRIPLNIMGQKYILIAGGVVDTANLFTGLLWDMIRNQPIDVIIKRGRHFLSARDKKRYLFDAFSFEDTIKIILGICESERTIQKRIIRSKVKKINCMFFDVVNTYDFRRKHPEETLDPDIKAAIEAGYWTEVARVCKIQIIFNQSGDDFIRGVPRKEDEFYLLMDRSNLFFATTSSWVDVENEWNEKWQDRQIAINAES